MRRASLVVASLALLGAIVWLAARGSDPRSRDSMSSTKPSVTDASSDADPLTLDTQPVPDSGDEGERVASSSADEARELAADHEVIRASRALAPDEPTLVKGRVVDRNGVAHAGCVVWIAPRVEAPDVGLKPGRSWPLDAAAIDRDGVSARLRSGVSDPDLDRDDEIARVRKAVTDSEGRFEIAGLPSGPLRLALRSQSLAPRDFDELVLDARATLDLGDLVLDFPLVLEGEVLDREGRAIAGARIDRVDCLTPSATLPGAALLAPLAVTAANGRFRTPPLAYGSFALLATHPAYLPERIDGAWEDAKRVQEPIVFTLDDGVALTGNVFGPTPEELATLCIVAEPEGTWRDASGIAAAESPLLAATASQRSAHVSADGRFQLIGLDPARAHSLRLGPLSPRGDELACVYLRARADAGAKQLDISLPRGGVVSFEVRGLGHAPVEEFEARVFGAAPETLFDDQGVIVRRHPGGAFRLEGVRFPLAPPQELSIRALGHALYTMKLYAEPGGDVMLGAIQLDPLYRVEVVVSDGEAGARIEGARIKSGELDPERAKRLGWRSATSDRKGLARVTSYSSSGSFVCVEADGFATRCIEFGESGWNARERCDVTLARGARVRVHVEDRKGTAVPGVVVSATGELGSTRSVSDREGIATFESMPPGVTKFAAVQMRALDDESSTETLVPIEGDLDVWITVPGLADLAGRVLDNGRPVAGADLVLRVLDAGRWKIGRRVDRGAAASTRSDSSGAFRFENVEAGPFAVDVTVERAVGPLRFDVVVEAPETSMEIDLEHAHLRGRVLDSRGRPQPGATVWVGSPQSRAPIDSRYSEALAAAMGTRDAAGRNTPCVTTDASGAFDLFTPHGAAALTIIASHPRAGAGFARVARVANTAVEADIQLAPAGSLEIEADPALAGASGLVVLVPEAEPSAWLVREERFGEASRWDALAAGAWTAWRIGIWVEDGEVELAPSARPITIMIEADRTTHARFEAQ